MEGRGGGGGVERERVDCHLKPRSQSFSYNIRMMPIMSHCKVLVLLLPFIGTYLQTVIIITRPFTRGRRFMFRGCHGDEIAT